MTWNVVGSLHLPEIEYDEDAWQRQWYQVGTVGEGGSTEVQTLVRTAGQAVGGHRLVVPDDDGSVVYASHQDVSQPGRPVWLTVSAAVQGAQVNLVAEGPVTESSWAWDEGPIFLGDAGMMTQSPPMTGMVMVVAWALAPTKCVFDPNPPIVLVG